MAALANPMYMNALTEFGKNPQEALKKFGHLPEF